MKVNEDPVFVAITRRDSVSSSSSSNVRNSSGPSLLELTGKNVTSFCKRFNKTGKNEETYLKSKKPI